ncbi:MAG: FMN-dependent NADPH-azoreductase [Alphaproteobacteria bacterium ADurb.Bin438]|nr:MAG: FMN-dependent NADPH-azoreductase [Alphaproteobacteria bacterium ADurb.Bin438]
MKNIGIIVGSLRKESLNRKLAIAITKLTNDVKFSFIEIKDLPLYNQDIEEPLPEIIKSFKNEIESKDAILFLCPEYNRSVSGALKNALDWGSRPYGTNSFKNKACAVAGISPGTTATAVAQNQLKPILLFLDMKVIGQPELYITHKQDMFDTELNFNDKSTKDFFGQFISKFISSI